MDTWEPTLSTGPLLGIAVAAIAVILVLVIYFKLHAFLTLVLVSLLTAFATGAMFGGFAGAFFATRQGFISPESFTFQESALVLAIVVLGGMGSQLGVALAALTMIGGFELFRGLDQYRMLVFGMAMVLLMIWRPRGLIGHRAPTVFLERNQAISSDLVKEGHG
mgnify:CR=1 FL=1